MRRAAQLIATTALVVLAGCRTAEVVYDADAKVSPDPEVPNQYIVKVRIMKIVPDAEPEIIWQPEFLTLKDHLASFSLDRDGHQVKCTVLVSDEKEGVMATIFVSVKERGKSAKSGRQTVKVANNPPPGEAEGPAEEPKI
ncbi:MAG: hypothetical protein WBC05_23785 [Sedimentisphaerales bacterium]